VWKRKSYYQVSMTRSLNFFLKFQFKAPQFQHYPPIYDLGGPCGLILVEWNWKWIYKYIFKDIHRSYKTQWTYNLDTNNLYWYHLLFWSKSQNETIILHYRNVLRPRCISTVSARTQMLINQQINQYHNVVIL